MTPEEHAAAAEGLLAPMVQLYEDAVFGNAGRLSADDHWAIQTAAALAQVHATLSLRPAPDDDPGGSAGG